MAGIRASFKDIGGKLLRKRGGGGK